MGAREAPSGPQARLYEPGSHVCLIYDDEAERRELVAQFVEEGLRSGERVAYFTDAAPQSIAAWLAEHGIEVPPAPQYSVSAARTVYCPDGRFEPQRMYGYWHEFHEQAAAAGFAQARATGETTWSREIEGGERIVEYEAGLNAVLATMPVTALCQYDVRRFDGATILDILRVHPTMLIGGRLVQNPYFVEPEQFLAEWRARPA